jgi:hypothetical protein
MSHGSGSRLRKRLLSEGNNSLDTTGQVDIAGCATIAYSSEDLAHPIENLLDDRSGVGGTYWAGARSDATEQIVIEFDAPQSISRLVYEVEETRLERTQEVRIEVSSDSGRTYRQLLAQDYTFSPQGATFQREDLRLNVSAVTHLRLTIMPAKNGSGKATLVSLRLFA